MGIDFNYCIKGKLTIDGSEGVPTPKQVSKWLKEEWGLNGKAYPQTIYTSNKKLDGAVAIYGATVVEVEGRD